MHRGGDGRRSVTAGVEVGRAGGRCGGRCRQEVGDCQVVEVQMLKKTQDMGPILLTVDFGTPSYDFTVNIFTYFIF
jgi:hypothetical protein